jgi:hypothetical protein
LNRAPDIRTGSRNIKAGSIRAVGTTGPCFNTIASVGQVIEQAGSVAGNQGIGCIVEAVSRIEEIGRSYLNREGGAGPVGEGGTQVAYNRGPKYGKAPGDGGIITGVIYPQTIIPIVQAVEPPGAITYLGSRNRIKQAVSWIKETVTNYPQTEIVAGGVGGCEGRRQGRPGSGSLKTAPDRGIAAAIPDLNAISPVVEVAENSGAVAIDAGSQRIKEAILRIGQSHRTGYGGRKSVAALVGNSYPVLDPDGRRQRIETTDKCGIGAGVIGPYAVTAIGQIGKSSGAVTGQLDVVGIEKTKTRTQEIAHVLYRGPERAAGKVDDIYIR